MMFFVMTNVVKVIIFFVDGTNCYRWKGMLVRNTVCTADLNLGCLNDLKGMAARGSVQKLLSGILYR
jgi:hypothetical protein